VHLQFVTAQLVILGYSEKIGAISPPYERHGNTLTVQYILNTKAKSKITCGYAAK